MSNYVSDDANLPTPGPGVTVDFNTQCADPDNFRLEAEHPTYTGGSVSVYLKVGSRSAITYTLAYKDASGGEKFRGDFLRLVTDSDDEGVKGSQTVLCALGEQVLFYYEDPNGCTNAQLIGVGRPPGSGGHLDQGAEGERGGLQPNQRDVLERRH